YFLRKHLPPKVVWPVVRWKNVMIQAGFFRLARRWPKFVRNLLRRAAMRELPDGFDIDTHFNPRYEPWDQRMCIVPDGDLFAAISSGAVSVVTDRIDTFTESGIRLASGEVLEADLVVTATGLQMVPFGGIRLAVDGRDVAVDSALAYRGMQISGVPNMAFAFGYTNQSWTLGADLTSAHVCKLLNHMDQGGYTHCTPRAGSPAATAVPFADLSSGYILRAVDKFPKQGTMTPWRREQNYARNRRELQRLTFDDPALEFSRAVAAGEAQTEVAA
ncbi:MAG TPA: NAD(P)/FAD-dependent oxidoreductase, partial [Gaiellales bacterium]|nr:NAD(P)/FAD-dependent oxidoreductase [Gaiellales bacterium]